MLKGRPTKARRPLSFVLRDMYERLLWETASLKECEEELKRLRPNYLKYCHLRNLETACADSIRTIYALIGEHIDWNGLPPNVRQAIRCAIDYPKKQGQKEVL